MVIWVMIILSTAATANGEWRTAGGGRPWVEAILIVKKMRDVSGEMKKCEKRDGGRERARPWPGRRVIQMKLEAYEKCVFLALKCTSTGHILWRTIRVRQSERERGGRRRKATWKPPETTSFILVLQFSIIKIIFARKVRPAFSVSFFFSFFRALLSGFYLRHFVLIEKGITLYLECNLEFCFFLFVVRQEMMLRSQQLSISSSVTAYFDIFGHDKREMMMEGGWGEAGRAAVSLLTHVDAWVQKRKKMKKIQIPCCKKNCTVCFIPGKLRVRPRKNRKRTPRAIYTLRKSHSNDETVGKPWQRS